jgi:photosystem II stability/assembly factor-like uncharacterized protein
LDEGWLLQVPIRGASRTVFHTTDGGQTWGELATLDAGNDITFRDRLTGWLAGRASNAPGLLTTNDGGLTWRRQPLAPLPPSPQSQAGAEVPIFLDQQQAVLRVSVLISQPDAPQLRVLDSFLYWSQDRGVTWNTSGKLPLATVKQDNYGTFFSFLDGRRGWAGSATSFYRTADGGATWIPIATSLPRSGFYFAELAEFGDRVAWGQLSDYSKRDGHQPIFILIRSTDGGVHWTELKIPGLEG